MRPPEPHDFRAPDPYAVLGISSSASAEESKQAYCTQVRAHPPERDPAAFKQIRAAYDQLKTPEKRLETDMLRFEAWPEPTLQTPAPIDMKLDPADVIRAARACSDLARNDWREDFREVKL
ncbi:MAG: heat shock protein DnaJ domain protein [Chthonomonadaceae bacterium]|nr:heat shock protein DnaJ domain protein [Chthonomonadaceae bacterium]